MQTICVWVRENDKMVSFLHVFATIEKWLSRKVEWTCDKNKTLGGQKAHSIMILACILSLCGMMVCALLQSCRKHLPPPHGKGKKEKNIGTFSRSEFFKNLPIYPNYFLFYVKLKDTNTSINEITRSQKADQILWRFNMRNCCHSSIWIYVIMYAREQVINHFWSCKYPHLDGFNQNQPKSKAVA